MWYDEFTKITPAPQLHRALPARWKIPDEVRVSLRGIDAARATFLWEYLHADLSHLLKRPIVRVEDADNAHFALYRSTPPDGAALSGDGYSLIVDDTGARVAAGETHGLFYAIQTLTQLLAQECRNGVLRHAHIVDWPHYPQRMMMLDLGRATFSMEYLKRIVRIASRLKYNTLHLHLHDNELNAVRYEGTPLGAENPFAHSLREYSDLIAYADQHFIEIIPEVESWGHVGSILQHYPQLYGATRLHGRGHSFGIGEATFALLEKLYDQWLEILPEGSKFHLGLDEANWRLLPGADASRHRKSTLARTLHELVQARAKAHGKTIRTMMWHDHKYTFDFIPTDIRDDVLAVPWHYHSTEKIESQLGKLTLRPAKQYAGDGRVRLPFIGGCGASGTHELGALLASQAWSWGGRNLPNCLGLDVMLWATNDLGRNLLTLYFGADCAWNPGAAQELLPGREYPEDEWGALVSQLRLWQAAFPDADPQALAQARGEEVIHGLYRWGENAGEPVAPQWMPHELFLGDDKEGTSTPPTVPPPAEEPSHRADEV